MGLQSLRDKLLQAGLVTEDQAKKAEAELEAKRRTARERRQGGPAGRGRGPGRNQPPRRELSEEERRKLEEEAAFREKERLLAKEREENRKRAAEDRKRLERLRELCDKYEVTERGDEPFHFTSRKKKVQKIFLTPEQLRKLEAGELAIMDKPLPGELAVALVTREAAEEAVRIDSRALRFYNRGGGETYGFKSDATAIQASEALAAKAEATRAAAPGAAAADTSDGTTATAPGEPAAAPAPAPATSDEPGTET